jgi:hypothetical protein
MKVLRFFSEISIYIVNQTKLNSVMWIDFYVILFLLASAMRLYFDCFNVDQQEREKTNHEKKQRESRQQDSI